MQNSTSRIYSDGCGIQTWDYALYGCRGGDGSDWPPFHFLSYRTAAMFDSRIPMCQTFVTVTCIPRQAKRRKSRMLWRFRYKVTITFVRLWKRHNTRDTLSSFLLVDVNRLRLQTFGHIVKGNGAQTWPHCWSSPLRRVVCNGSPLLPMCLPHYLVVHHSWPIFYVCCPLRPWPAPPFLSINLPIQHSSL